MKYSYKFNNEEVTIEVNESEYEILVALDREEYNSNRKHSRRYPLSFDNLEYEDARFADDTDILKELIENQENQHLISAIAKLKPEQQDLIRAIYFNEIPVTEYAKIQGVSHSAISHRLKTTYKALKTLMKK